MEPLIIRQLLAVMKDVGAIRKAKSTGEGRYSFNFRGIDDVYNAVQPALVEHGVVIIPEVISHEDTATVTDKGRKGWRVMARMRFTFKATDGSSVSAIMLGEAADYSDKAANKAMSMAFKYALFQVLCIPTEDQEDADASIPETGVDAAREAQREQPGDKVEALRAFEETLTDAFGNNDAKKLEVREWAEKKLGRALDKAPARAINGITNGLREKMRAEEANA